MIGMNLAHYRITGELGVGGMGEAWWATSAEPLYSIGRGYGR